MSLVSLQKQQSSRLYRLIALYIMVAILFVLPLDLHIHSGEISDVQVHGTAVGISEYLTEEALPTGDEIDVSINELIKKEFSSFDLHAAVVIFLLLVVAVRRLVNHLSIEPDPIHPSSYSYALAVTRAPPAFPSQAD